MKKPEKYEYTLNTNLWWQKSGWWLLLGKWYWVRKGKRETSSVPKIFHISNLGGGPEHVHTGKTASSWTLKAFHCIYTRPYKNFLSHTLCVSSHWVAVSLTLHSHCTPDIELNSTDRSRWKALFAMKHWVWALQTEAVYLVYSFLRQCQPSHSELICRWDLIFAKKKWNFFVKLQFQDL